MTAVAGFWWGGFEGADHVNGDGVALDLVAQSGHLAQLDDDHRRAAAAGLRVVRESIGWRLSEGAGGRIDLERALRVQHSACRHGLQVAWTLMHYGLPPDLSLHDDAMIARLARFAAEVARTLGPAIYTPVNEIGFLAWCASQHGLLAPPNDSPRAGAEDSRISGWAVKRRLAAAAIAAVRAMREVQPGACFMHVEPLVHVVPPPGRPDLAAQADEVASWQWQAWDLLTGRAEPALGGEPALMDLVGVNHYHSSQWELASEARLDWSGRDPRRRPFGDLLREAADRYGQPLVVAETSHVGIGRAPWLHEIAREVREARRGGVDVRGLCLYPLTDRPDWQRPEHWHRSGLWHVDPPDGLRRHADADLMAALREWQRAGDEPPPRRTLVVFSHLRWDFVRHRLRHLAEGLSRRGWRIVFVEEPLNGPARLDRIAAGPHVEVLVPYADADGDGRTLLPAWCRAHGVVRPTVLLGTPMAAALAAALQPSRVVYDCGDELSAFLGAPPELPRREQTLLAAADLVTVASEGLAAPREAGARRLRRLPNGVDLPHFAVGGPHAGWAAEEAAALRPRDDGPQLGHAGVIDERLDLALVDALAEARPQWQWVFAGPVVKIDPASLPRRANLHWLGAVPYRVLPALMASWRAAVLPFRIIEATRHAQPLKVLEALAAGLSVVATPLPELRPWHAAGVRLAATAADFIDACEAAQAETTAQAAARLQAARHLLAGRDWDAVAAALDDHLCSLDEPCIDRRVALRTP